MDQFAYLHARPGAPSVVDPDTVSRCKSYREAVQLCWELRENDLMTQATLAEQTGLYAPHVTCYLNDNKRKRDLPAWAIDKFEAACGNAAISQWIAMGARLTVYEEMQATSGARSSTSRVGRGVHEVTTRLVPQLIKRAVGEAKQERPAHRDLSNFFRAAVSTHEVAMA